MKNQQVFIISIVCCFCFACQANKTAIPSNEDKQYIQAKPNAPGTYYTLADHLIRVPGVQKVDGVFRIRDARSFNGEMEPLYVINGVPLGQSYERANSLVDVNDIESVKVLKSVGATNKYGMRGAAGVVEIKTKTSE